MVVKVLIGILPLVTGCLFSDEARVAPISEFRPLASVGDEAKITFEHSGDSLDSNTCIVLEDGATATLAGLPFELVVKGGTGEAGSCVFPQMKLVDLPELADATIELRDSHTTINCALGDSLLPFPIETIPAGPWRFTPGQAVTVVTTQPADTTDLHAALVSADYTRAELVATQAGNEITFTLPFGVSGEFELQINARHTIKSASDYAYKCGGVLFTGHHAHRTITIAP